ncbi:hypothetical protein D1872_299450 [compost metagenome]
MRSPIIFMTLRKPVPCISPNVVMTVVTHLIIPQPTSAGKMGVKTPAIVSSTALIGLRLRVGPLSSAVPRPSGTSF